MNDVKRVTPYQSPIRLLLILGSSIFTIELSIMLLVFLLPPLSMWVGALADSVLLVVLIFPTLYFFVFRPLALHIAERERMEAELRKAHEQLETRIRERTVELEQINKELHTKIVEHKESENRLREAEVRYRTLFEQSPFGVVLLDPETTLPVEFNETAHRQLGYSRDEFSRMRISDYESSEEPAETERHVHVVLRDGEDDFETRHRTKQGGIRNVHVTTKAVSLSGRAHSTISFVTSPTTGKPRRRSSRQTPNSPIG